MSISRDEVAHIASLARLDLTQDEMAAIGRDLARILEYVRRIDALDDVEPAEPGPEIGAAAATPGGAAASDESYTPVSPAAAAPHAAAASGLNPAAASTPFRDDIVLPSLGASEALRPSADHDEAFFRVPAVIERVDEP